MPMFRRFTVLLPKDKNIPLEILSGMYRQLFENAYNEAFQEVAQERGVKVVWDKEAPKEENVLASKE